MKSKHYKSWVSLGILLVIIAAAIIRIKIYGDVRLSIATNDTPSYVEASRVSLFSSEIMTGRRLLSTNLIYKLLRPQSGYEILVNGSIFTSQRLIQPGFDRIVILQLILSIIGWGLLAYVTAKYISNIGLKFMGALIILAFAFTPQVADWDSVLMSESLSFSLFAIQLALLIEIMFAIYKDEHKVARVYSIPWAVVFFLWIYLKDTNLFCALTTGGLMIALLLKPKNRKSPLLWSMLIFISFTFALGLITSSLSTRSTVQMRNIYHDDLLTSPASIKTLTDLGMPEPKSSGYEKWFEENSLKTLAKFMLIHPGYPTFKIIKDFPSAFTEISQTYFKAPEQYPARGFLLAFGNTLHPETPTPFLMDLLLLFGITCFAFQHRNDISLPWAWMAYWLFLTAGITLIPAILGDTWGLNRHALFSTTLYRLCMWMFPITIMDFLISSRIPETSSN